MASWVHKFHWASRSSRQHVCLQPIHCARRGIVLPVLETLRRWGTWWDYPPAYLDDVFLGAFFLFAVWKCARDRRAGQRYLAAAWGLACGMGYMSRP
jgi:hypothetical protein